MHKTGLDFRKELTNIFWVDITHVCLKAPHHNRLGMPFIRKNIPNENVLGEGETYYGGIMGSKKVMWNLFVPFVVMFVAAVGVANADTCCQGNSCQESCSKDDCYGFFAGANFLYWTTNQSDLDYAVDSLLFKNKGTPNGKVHYLDYEWDPGYRIALGYDLGCDFGRMGLVYTHFSQEASGHKRSSTTRDLFSTVFASSADNITHFNSFDPIRFAKGKKDLDYDVLDLLFSRPICLNQRSVLLPFVGIRGLCLNQDLKLSCIPKELNSDKIDNFVVKNQSKYSAVGLRAGIGYSFSICSGFGFYTDVSGSALSGQTDDHQRFVGFADSVLTQTYVNVKDRQHTSLFGYQIGLGISYDTCVCGHAIGLGIGYEMNEWLNVPCLRRWTNADQIGTTITATDSNLLLHGLTIKASTEF